MEKEFNWVEGVTTVKDIVKSLATELSTASVHSWSLKTPGALGEITDKCILESENAQGKKFYLAVKRPEGNLEHIILQIGDGYNAETGELEEGKRSEEAMFSWYRNTEGLYIGQWLPVQYWMSFSGTYANIVIQGDPSPDKAPYDNYMISYAYIGALQSYDNADEDSQYNFALTCSSSALPLEEERLKEFGERTGTGVTDIVMAGTRTGTPYQAHYPAFHTTNPFMDKNFISASAWTHKYHFSEVVVAHAYDRERGKMQNMLVGDRSAVFHLDELIQDKGLETEKTYKMFNINAPYSFLNNSPNVLYGIAVRKG